MHNELSNVMNEIQSIRSLATFSHFQSFVNKTIIQWERIQEDKKQFPAINRNEHDKIMTILFLDVYCYFVCYNRAQKLLESFIKTECDLSLCKLWRKFKTMFKPFNDARNHLEHIEERIKRKDVFDLGNLRGDTFTFAGKLFDVGEYGLEILKDAYEEVVGILHLRQKNNRSYNKC